MLVGMSNDHIMERRETQARRINVNGVEAINCRGDKAAARVVVHRHADWPGVLINTPWGQIEYEISWDLFDDLAVAAGQGKLGTVRV